MRVTQPLSGECTAQFSVGPTTCARNCDATYSLNYIIGTLQTLQFTGNVARAVEECSTAVDAHPSNFSAGKWRNDTAAVTLIQPLMLSLRTQGGKTGVTRIAHAALGHAFAKRRMHPTLPRTTTVSCNHRHDSLRATFAVSGCAVRKTRAAVASSRRHTCALATTLINCKNGNGLIFKINLCSLQATLRARQRNVPPPCRCTLASPAWVGGGTTRQP